MLFPMSNKRVGMVVKTLGIIAFMHLWFPTGVCQDHSSDSFDLSSRKRSLEVPRQEGKRVKASPEREIAPIGSPDWLLEKIHQQQRLNANNPRQSSSTQSTVKDADHKLTMFIDRLRHVPQPSGYFTSPRMPLPSPSLVCPNPAIIEKSTEKRTPRHAQVFKRVVGFSSAKQYLRCVEANYPLIAKQLEDARSQGANSGAEILHIQAFCNHGPLADRADNLLVGNSVANYLMRAADERVPCGVVDASFATTMGQDGTRIAESFHQVYANPMTGGVLAHGSVRAFAPGTQKDNKPAFKKRQKAFDLASMFIILVSQCQERAHNVEVLKRRGLEGKALEDAVRELSGWQQPEDILPDDKKNMSEENTDVEPEEGEGRGNQEGESE